MNTYRFGADPEMFAYKDGKPVSAYGLIAGDKYNPFPVDGGAVQVDGMALEFNIDPVLTEDQFVSNLNKVITTLRGMVPGYEVVATPVAEFGHEYIAAQPHEATDLGCNPDFDAWKEGLVNERPNVHLPFRTGAGHIHIGWVDSNDACIYDPAHVDECCARIKQLDYYLGLPSLFFDKGVKRREMYGKPGAFRPKTYGAEYRVLSNAWLGTDDLKRWAFRNAKAAMDAVDSGHLAFSRVSGKIMDNMMDPNPDLRRVRQVLDKLNIELPKVA